jgi:ribulose-5-phosphate 4-epimerase/fuculose-1-phosphate aldolase
VLALERQRIPAAGYCYIVRWGRGLERTQYNMPSVSKHAIDCAEARIKSDWVVTRKLWAHHGASDTLRCASAEEILWQDFGVIF